MRRILFSIVSALALLSGRSTAQTPYDSCGTMIQGSVCPLLFQDTNNQLWLLNNNSGLNVGDQVRVIGTVPPLCFTLCGAGCITISVVVACQPPPGTPYCPGDGSGTACPCGNASAVGADRGCTNSLGNSGQVLGTGVASVSADTVVLAADGMPNGPALYFQGTTPLNAGAGVAFGDGLRCAGGTIVRLGVRTNVSGASQFPAVGNPGLAQTGGAAGGSVQRYQVWYRDSATFCTGATFNLTNAYEISWAP